MLCAEYGQEGRGHDESVSGTNQPTSSASLTAAGRLLGVYDKLRGVGAAPNDEEEQHALVEQARGLILDICNDHVFAAEAFIQDPDLRASLTDQVKTECQELVDYVVASKRFNLEINARSKDRVISFGEKLSCQFMTALLQDSVSSSPTYLLAWWPTPTDALSRGLRPNTSTCATSFIMRRQHSLMPASTRRQRRPLPTRLLRADHACPS